MTRSYFTPCSILLLVGAILPGGFTAHAQNIMPVAVCAEYYTTPVTGSIGANYNPDSTGTPLGATGTRGFIAHFAYLSTEAAPVTLSAGAGNNYFSPGISMVPQTTNGVSFQGDHPREFVPGLSPDLRLEVEYVPKTWNLAGNTDTVTPAGITVNNVAATPSPTCDPTYVPSTALTYNQPATYLHQFLGQVDSGPPAGPTFTLSSLSGVSNVNVSNLSYVPNDTANPSGTFNPNSIYGDVQIGYGPAIPVAVRVQLVADGKVVMKGMTSIGYTGPSVPANLQIIGGSPQSAGVGTQFGAALQVQVTDSGSNPISGLSVTFSAPTSGATAALSSAPVTDANGLTSVTATAGTAPGSYLVTACVAGYSLSATFSLTNTAQTTTAVTNVVGVGGTSLSQPVQLSATVSSPAGTFNGGAVTFLVTNSANTPVAIPVSGVVANGIATAAFTIPPSLAIGTYTINAAFRGSPTTGPTVYLGSSSTSQLSLLAVGTPIRVTQLSVTSGSGGTYVVNITLSNPTGSDVTGVTLTKAQLGSTVPRLSPPVGTIAANSGVTLPVEFPATAGTSGSMVTLTISGTYSGGSFSAGTRIALP
jgi:hypothetical protein